MFKWTKPICSRKAAVAWAQKYCDEWELSKTRPGGQEEKGQNLQPGIGVNCFTTRPAGLLSAHGFVRPAIDRIKLVYGLDDNAAALKYIENYCAAQRHQRQPCIAIRGIISLDPSIIDPITTNMFDLDHALVAGVERTFQALASQRDSGDEVGFFIGIHHEELTTANPIARRPGKARSGAKRWPQIHARFFLLPWTAMGKRVASSDGGPVGFLESARNHFFMEARLSLASLPGPVHEVFLSPAWNALAKMAAHLAFEDFRKGQEMKPASSRDYIAHRMLYYLKVLDKDHLKRRLMERVERINQMMKEKKTLADVDAYNQVTLDALRPGITERAKQLRQMRDTYQASLRPPNISVHLLQATKAVLTSRVDLRKDFCSELKDLCQTLKMRRMGTRITLLADTAEAELIRASVREKYPAWMATLQTACLSVMPNHHSWRRSRPTQSSNGKGPLF